VNTVVASVVVSLFDSLCFLIRSRALRHLKIIALRHQLAVVRRSRRPRLRLTSADRLLWAWLPHTWRGWRTAVHIVTPETVVTWHRRGFRLFWTWKSRRRTGRPGVPPDVRALIRELSALVRAAPEFRRAEADRELITLPTGDGMALVFFRYPLAPAQCALEITRAAAAGTRPWSRS